MANEITWLFVLVGVLISFPILVVSIGDFMESDIVESDYEFEGSTGGLSLGENITLFFKTLGSFPSGLQFIIYTIYSVMIGYIVIKMLPFT